MAAPVFGVQQLQGVLLQVVQLDVILSAQGQLLIHVQLLGAVVEQGGDPGLGLVGPILPGQAHGLLLRAQHMGHALGLQIAQGDGPQLVRGQVMQVRVNAVKPPALDIAVYGVRHQVPAPACGKGLPHLGVEDRSMTCRLAMMATVAPYFVSSSRFWKRQILPRLGVGSVKGPMGRDRMSGA